MKNLKKEFIKNTSYVSIAKIFENVFSYLIIILITRHLGAKGLGQYSFIFSFVGLFFIFSDLGLTPLMTKDLSKDISRIKNYVSNIFTIKLIFGIISLILYSVILLFIGKKDLLLPLYMAGFIELFNKMFSLPKSILRIYNNGKILAFINVGERVIALLGAFILIPLTENLLWFIFVLLISYFLKSIISFLHVRKYSDFTFNLNWNYTTNLLKKSYPFIFIGLFSIIYVRMDTVMLSFLKNDKVVGWYNAGYKIIKVINIIPVLLLTFGFPLFSNYFSEDNKVALKKLFEKLIEILLIIIIPAVIGVFYLGERILKLIYDINTIEAGHSFKILIIAEIFIFLTIIMGRFIAAADKQKIFMKIAGIGALFNILLNIILIPNYSLYGAGIATLLTYFLMFVIMYFYIKKNLLKFDFFKYFILPLFSTGLMWIVISNVLHFHILLVILICALVYLIPISLYFILFGDAIITIKELI